MSSTRLVLEKLETVLLIQIPAPELLVVLRVCVIPVQGAYPLFPESLRRANDRIIVWAKERGDRYPRLLDIDDRPVPHALISTVAQCLQNDR